MARNTSRKKAKSKVVSRSVTPLVLNFRNKWAVVAIALFASIGSYFVYQSFASPLYSSSPNDVVLEYIPPHNDIETEGRLSDAHNSPFTLYANGLLVCGQDDEHQFDVPRLPEEGEVHEHGSLPATARILSRKDMSNFIQSVRDTGFERLDNEYFDVPVAQQKYMVRLVLKKSEKVVQYYNDVEAPTAYAETVALMQSACAITTETYVPNSVTIRSRADVQASGVNPESLEAIKTPAVNKVREALTKSKASKRQNDAKRQANQELQEADEAALTITGSEASSLLRAMNGKSTKVIKDGTATFEIGVQANLPKPNNPLNLDYNAIREKTEKKQKNGNKSAAAKLIDVLDPSAPVSAQTTPKGYRVVLLLPSSGGSTSMKEEISTMRGQMQRWMCNEVGKCPTYHGFFIRRGSQTQAYYNACHSSYCNGNQLYNILVNVRNKDAGTLYRSDMATIIIPGWKTNTLSTSGTKACGWGMMPGTLSTIDMYQTTTVNGLTCKNTRLPAYAHEFVHNIGLGHVPDCTPKNLLDGPPGCRYSNGCTLAGTSGPICNLWGSQVNTILRSGRY